LQRYISVMTDEQLRTILRAELAPLQRDLAAMKAQIDAIKAQIDSMKPQIDAMKAQIEDLPRIRALVDDLPRIRALVDGIPLAGRMATTTQHELRALRAAFNDFARTAMTAGEIDALHEDVNKVQAD
jgi:multidrug resistance efflux pump